MSSSDPAPTIITVGSTMRDMVTYVDRLPGDGETVHGHDFVRGFGGKGANQSVMARRLGADVAFVGCVGDDPFGADIVANLDREGVDTTAMTVAAGVSSGVAPIWVDPTGVNRIVVVPGANNHLTDHHAARSVSQAPRVDVVVGQFEIPPSVTLAGFRAARDRGAVTVLNPAPSAAIDDELLAVTDVLVPNEHEFADLSGSTPSSPALTDTALQAAAAHWDTQLVVTLGEAGAAIAEPGRSVIRVPAPATTAVDTTGAGDAFVGGLCVGIGAGWPLSDAARLGCACGAASVTRPGTQTSYPSRAEARAILAGCTPQ